MAFSIINRHPRLVILTVTGLVLVGLIIFPIRYQQLSHRASQLDRQLENALTEVNDLKQQDQFLINQELEATIQAIEVSYNQAVSLYEAILDLRVAGQETIDLEVLLAEGLNLLSQRDYLLAEEKLSQLDQEITQLNQEMVSRSKQADTGGVTEDAVASNNTPPDSGYQRQLVVTEVGSFTVDIIAANLSSTRVIVDTASSGDCDNDCPVLPLAGYISRNQAFAGVNGSYFCPASYPSCAGKTNSFDTLLMNKDKVYFNSENNVYSTVPAVIFYGNQARFVSASHEWGRDTGVDAVLANHPLLVQDGKVVFGGDSDPKKGSRAGRSFVGVSGSMVYIGVVRGATVAESARVLQVLGITDALNLDSGGSTALWWGGYRVGPGRDIPNALLLVRR